MNCESLLGKMGSLSVSSYFRHSIRAIHYAPLGPQRCLSPLFLCAGVPNTIWFPASRPAQPYRKLYNRKPGGPMPRWAAPWRRRRRGEFPITKRGRGSSAIAVRSSTEPAILGLRCGQGS